MSQIALFDHFFVSLVFCLYILISMCVFLFCFVFLFFFFKRERKVGREMGTIREGRMVIRIYSKKQSRVDGMKVDLEEVEGSDRV